MKLIYEYIYLYFQDENDAGVLYSGLISCQQRFQHFLDSTMENDNIKGSLCLGTIHILRKHFV